MSSVIELLLEPKSLAATYTLSELGKPRRDIKLIYDQKTKLFLVSDTLNEYAPADGAQRGVEMTLTIVQELLAAGYSRLSINEPDFKVICNSKNKTWVETCTSLKKAFVYATEITTKYKNTKVQITEGTGTPNAEPQADPLVEALKAKRAASRIPGQHKLLPLLLKLCESRVHSFLVGPAGSGKSSAAEQVAKKLDLPFYAQSVCSQTSKSELLGYMDANGKYVQSLFRKAYEHGGIFLLDEVDAGNANVLAVLNSALSNDFCSFPDAMVRRHKDFILTSSANTFGSGADRQYVGRNQLDAATLDRFVVLEWNYDHDFELELAKNDEWVTFIQKVRKVVTDLKIRHVVSPRASITGAKLLDAGLPREQVEKMVLWKGIDSDSLKTIKTKLAS